MSTAAETCYQDLHKRWHQEAMLNSIMFDQAQTEIQLLMEDNAYQMVLTSDIVLKYVCSRGENTAYMNDMRLGSLNVLCSCSPTLNEEKEWTCADFKCKFSPTVVGLSQQDSGCELNGDC